MTTGKRKGSNPGLGLCLVTGGSGMLGAAIAKILQGDRVPVRSLDIVPPQEKAGAEFIRGDIRDRELLTRAAEGVETVFHTAAAVWNPRTPARLYDQVNVGGTRNVIDACVAAGVKRLVFTGTMDVVVEGRRPITNGDETIPYPRRMPEDRYSRSKILSEREAIAANGRCGLLTCSLRPVGMYGPGDRYHLPAIIEAARSRFNVALGDGTALFSHVYAENAAHAHVLAARHLRPGSPVCGQCYFVTDHAPKNLFTFMEPFLLELGLPIPKRRIPYRLAYLLAWVAEHLNPNTKFTRFAVVQTCVDHTFSGARAARDFGYRPAVTEEEAFRRTIEWFRGRGFGRGKN
ncbi:MAG: NAD-dependent epimerase/dehydratase family protein [Spirochaetes bacterium]|nr:NAD-dependent epimerase/dehydratase family protein [Spirochaetota bacterium]